MTLTRAPLRRRSATKARADAERSRLIAQYRREGRDQCEIRPWLVLAMASDPYSPRPDLRYGVYGCGGATQGLHERRKRSAGGSLTNRQNLIPACNHCNGWVEDNPLAARAIGLAVRPGDPEWEELAA